MKAEGVRYVLVNNRELAKGDYGLFFHFHFLEEKDALAFLEQRRKGLFNADLFWARVSSSPRFQDYRAFLNDHQQLQRIFPADEGQEADLAVYELL